MPELPEVETIKNQINPILPLKIEAAIFSPLTKRIVKQMDFDPTGFTITKIRRHAKWLIFDLAPHGHILSHLGMSGSWQMSHAPLSEKHGHIEFIDKKKSEFGVLTYIDPRRFGHLYVLSDENFKKKEDSLPIDISSPDFDKEQIALTLYSHPNKPIKPFLLDQKAFPGVGNYMASEICARAGILPTRLAGDIEADEIEKMKAAMDVVISGAVETKGTTFSGGYRDANGSKGEGVKHLVVFYQHHCQMCLERGKVTKVIKTTMAGRGTYHCPVCQK
ncbi:Fpg/Nei family DNA glycosylase [Bacteriovorax stolpii]|uniref:Fpg/Nei family DNA glycosylase n=1 Tax=Bacteriovorax stolpii TaxID=960 RepID=UPI00234FD110|nr:DNA-formamidopyrimidine glycosylase family protein [Bacteriovorax stolpii]